MIWNIDPVAISFLGLKVHWYGILFALAICQCSEYIISVTGASMLFLVVSSPNPQRPSEVKEQRRKYWPWAQDKLDKGLAISFYARTGRGAVAIFDVDSNDVLHRLLNEWSEIVPVKFDIYPLLDTESIKSCLES